MAKNLNKNLELINRKKVKGLLVENGISIDDFSKDLGISRQQLYLKLNGEYQFTESEIFILRRNFGNDIFLN